MTEVIPLAEGGNGSVLAYPVFSADGNFTVCGEHRVFAVQTDRTGHRKSDGTGTVYLHGRTDRGLLLYHADSELVGKQTFNESVFAVS